MFVAVGSSIGRLRSHRTDFAGNGFLASFCRSFLSPARFLSNSLASAPDSRHQIYTRAFDSLQRPFHPAKKRKPASTLPLPRPPPLLSPFAARAPAPAPGRASLPLPLSRRADTPAGPATAVSALHVLSLSLSPILNPRSVMARAQARRRGARATPTWRYGGAG